MTSLLYKDWVLVKKTWAVLISLFYLLLIIPNESGSLMINYSTNFIFLFITYMFFAYLAAYDYKYNGLTFTAAFPVSKKDMVVSRYVFMAASFAVFIAVFTLLRTGFLYLKGMEYHLDLQQIGTYILVFSLFYSIVLPLYYRLGYQKIRWIIFIGMFAMALLTGFLQKSQLVLDTPVFLITAFIAGAIMYVISVEISCTILERTDL